MTTNDQTENLASSKLDLFAALFGDAFDQLFEELHDRGIIDEDHYVVDGAKFEIAVKTTASLKRPGRRDQEFDASMYVGMQDAG